MNQFIRIIVLNVIFTVLAIWGIVATFGWLTLIALITWCCVEFALLYWPARSELRAAYRELRETRHD